MSATSELRRVHVFADLTEEDLAWLVEHGELQTLSAGDAVVREGDPASVMIAIIEGELRATREQGSPDGKVFMVKAGGVSGMLPFSRLTHFPVTSRAVGPARVFRFPAERFPELLEHIPVLEGRLVTAMAERVREAAREDHQRETLLALGKLSAGLAHELNNPAAAARRSARELVHRAALLPRLVETLLGLDLSPEAIRALSEMRASLESRAGMGDIDALQRAEMEEALAAWIGDHRIADPWTLAENLTDGGFRVDDVEEVRAAIPAEALGPALAWIAESLIVQRLAGDVERAAERISLLVAAVKSYSHMDQAPTPVPTDINLGIESTVSMLGHNLRSKGIRVTRELSPELPPVRAFPGELNQVWTNLLDNAIDVLPTGGRITVRTGRERDQALIEFIDDGPGIPPGIVGRIFEPFFTTKDVGRGTGLGLDIAHRIVVRRHGGDIRVDSVPGHTRFQVRIPLGSS